MKLRALFILFLLCLIATTAHAHPGSGIVVDPQGNVYFQDTVARIVWKIDPANTLSKYYTNSGGHWMCLDRAGVFANSQPKFHFQRISPAGTKPAVIFADGGAPIAVCTDGNLYYGSGYPGGADTDPAGLTVTRMTSDGQKILFSPALKTLLASRNDGVTGLCAGPDNTLYVSTPASILKVQMDGTVQTLAHPITMQHCEEPRETAAKATFHHGPQLRGLDVTTNGTVYVAASEGHCVLKITPEGKITNVLKSQAPWSPTGVAEHAGSLYVLEYTNANGSPAEGWQPRIRKLSPNGQTTTLVTLRPEGRSLPAR